MKQLGGLSAPAGEGAVIEVHLDIMSAPDEFFDRLRGWGFENDPFLDFFPPEYRFHYTGRTRAAASEVRTVLAEVDEVIEAILAEARRLEVRLYAECELVRDIHHFQNGEAPRGFTGLDGTEFRKSQSEGTAKADVHVEFVSGTVSDELRARLQECGYYWVRTPPSEHFPSEDIATLQTSVFRDAQMAYERLIAAPLPGCTGIHLEQKLAMIASYPDLPMPQVMELAKPGDLSV